LSYFSAKLSLSISPFNFIFSYFNSDISLFDLFFSYFNSDISSFGFDFSSYLVSVPIVKYDMILFISFCFSSSRVK